MLFCTNQSDRQLSPCHSHPWFLKSLFVSLTVFLFLELFYSFVWLPCKPTSSYWIFLIGWEKDFQLVLWLAGEQFFQSLLQAEFSLFRNCPGNVRSKWTNLSILFLFLLVARDSQFLEQIVFQIPAKSFIMINLS